MIKTHYEIHYRTKKGDVGVWSYGPYASQVDAYIDAKDFKYIKRTIDNLDAVLIVQVKTSTVTAQEIMK